MTDLIRVITTCTSRKVVSTSAVGDESLPGLDSTAALPAETLYAGEQHRRLMRGVGVLRASRPVDVWVISAGNGLVAGTTAMMPYDESFTCLTPEEVRRRADALGIPADMRELVARPAALTILLAGNDYFDAARLDHPVTWGSPTIALVSPSRSACLVPHSMLTVLPVGQKTARTRSLPLTLLKGQIASEILFSLAHGANVASLTSELYGSSRLAEPPSERVAH